MNAVADTAWFREHTAGAPEALRVRAARFFDDAADGMLVDRLAAAGGDALAEATRDGARRAAALDLLAADALITLALLRAAEIDPANLGRAAANLRQQATAGS